MLLRRLKAILISGLVWALSWIPLSLAAGILRYYRTPRYDLILDSRVPPPRPPALPIIAQEAAVWTIWAAVVGGLFAVILLAAESRRTLAELRLWRFAVWGALAGITLPLSILILIVITEGGLNVGWQFSVILLLSGVFGAACGAAMLRMARRAS